MEPDVKLIPLEEHFGDFVHMLKCSSIFKDTKQHKEKLFFGFFVIFESREEWDSFQISLFMKCYQHF